MTRNNEFLEFYPINAVNAERIYKKNTTLTQTVWPLEIPDDDLRRGVGMAFGRDPLWELFKEKVWKAESERIDRLFMEGIREIERGEMLPVKCPYCGHIEGPRSHFLILPEDPIYRNILKALKIKTPTPRILTPTAIRPTYGTGRMARSLRKGLFYANRNFWTALCPDGEL